MTLFRAFLHEQDDPDRFYRTLADDSVAQLARWTDVRGAVVLDVGGGPGYFADAFRSHGAVYAAVDPDLGEMTARGRPGTGVVRADGTALPIRTGAVDVCYSSNVLEHERRPRAMIDEMVRVTRPGGIVYVAFTPWWSPWGGHETAPWHVLGGAYARRRYARRRGHEPKNRYGESLFALSVREAIALARRTPGVVLVDVRPRYHPWWARWVVRVPLVREVASWNLVLVLGKRP